MDANLQRLHPLASRSDWRLDEATRVLWDARTRMLRLAGTRVPRWSEAIDDGAARRSIAPGAIDRFDTRARVEEIAAAGGPRWRVIAAGAVRGEVEIVAPGADEITDAAIGADGVLYLAIGGSVRLHDLRARWDDHDVAVDGGAAWRLAPIPTGGVHVAIRGGAGRVTALGDVSGYPMRPLPHRFGDEVFRPDPEDPDPPRFIPRGAPPAGDVAALATSPGGRLAMLAWTAGDAELHVRDGGAWRVRTLAGARRPYSLAWVDEDQVAVLIATTDGGTTAAVYTAEGGATAHPVGELYPLREPLPRPFLHGAAAPPHYLGRAGDGDEARALLPLSWPAFASSGSVTARVPLDGTAPGAVWHRIYLEAAIPPGSSVTVWLAAADGPGAPAAADWFPHRFGDPGGDRASPRGTWVRDASELPFHAGQLGCPPRRGVAGLFTALIQRTGRRVRTLAGRYLHVRLEIAGDGRATPEIAACRIYSNRRGYAGLYLPELYREDTFGPDADQPGAATGADFLDRFLGLFESVLTPLEGRIASAWLLTHPRTAGDETLEWLASWLGFVFAADLPPARRRRMLEEAWLLFQRRGTLLGLRRALDLASDGGVGRGEIVVIEDFRLRRTFATILGAELSEPDDPFAPGLTSSGNSIVGDTLILGQEERRAFLALFDEDLVLGDALHEVIDEAAIDQLFDRVAHRVTVLVHQEVAEQDLGLLRQVIDLEAPAHVQVKVITATHRFRVAVSSLVGVDTFLGPRPPPSPVIVDRSLLGVADTISRLPSLDPRLGRTS